VYNILEKKKEVENILFENTEFLILKDYVFVNSKNIDDLHLLALPLRRDIKSLRDLKGEHIEMLEEMQKKGLE
jgi:m7GpppX diphosphatase